MKCPYCGSINTVNTSPPYFALRYGKEGDDIESCVNCLDCDKAFVVFYTQKRVAKISESTRFRDNSQI